MSAIAWWVVPIVATVLAIVYVTWRGRPRPPEDTHEAMEARERFRRAIEDGNAKQRKSRSTGRSAKPADRTDGAGGTDSAGDVEQPGG